MNYRLGKIQSNENLFNAHNIVNTFGGFVPKMYLLRKVFSEMRTVYFKSKLILPKFTFDLFDF